METKFTLFKNRKGTLSKTVSLKNGELQKVAAASMYSGTFETISLDFEIEFGEFISNLNFNNAIAHGVSCRLGADNQVLSSGSIVKNGSQWDPKDGVISRTQENFNYHGVGVRNGSNNFRKFECSTPNLIMLDLDELDQSKSIEEIVLEIFEDLPIFAKLGCWAYPSAGSYIYHGEEELTGLTGLHLYALLPQEVEVENFKNYVDVTLWNKGKGKIFITKSGQRLKRTYVDLSVFSSERLDFIAGSECKGDLEQRRPEPIFFNPFGDELTNTALFTSSEAEQAEIRKTKAYHASKIEADKVKGVFTQTLANKAGLGRSDAEKLVQLVHAGKIGGSHPIHMDDGTQVPAWKIAFHSDEFSKRTCADPVEPEYGGLSGAYGINKAICYTNGISNTSIFSHAHGGVNWKIVIDFMSAKSILELYGEAELMETLGSDWMSFLADDGLTQGDRERLFETIKKKQNISKEQIKSMFDSSAGVISKTELEHHLEKLNEIYALISTKGKVRIVAESYDPDMNQHSIDLMTKADFLLLHDNLFVYAWVGGKRKKLKVAQAWLEWEHRQYFKGFIFDPAKAPRVDGYLNLFKGYAVPNRPISSRKCQGKFCHGNGCIWWFDNKGWKTSSYGEDDWTDDWGCWKQKGKLSDIDQGSMNVQFWLRHIFEVLANGDYQLYLWCLDWFTDIIQNPGGDRPGTSLAVQGLKGTGKGAIFNTIQDLFGQHSFHTSSMKELTGNFNAHLHRVVFLFADEAIFSGDKVAEGTLKRLITEPTLNITFKGYDTFKVMNRLRIGISSNEHWMVPASVDERRFCVCKAWDGRIKDQDWFDRVYHPSLEELLDELLNRKIQSSLREAPVTEALEEQIIHSQDIVTEFHSTLHEVKPEWFMGNPVSSQDIWDLFQDIYKNNHGFGYNTKSKLGRRMAALGPNDERKLYRFDDKPGRGVIFEQRKIEDFV